MGNQTCRFIALATGPVARIEQCSCCGTIAVHLGALSFRVDAEVLGSLWTTLGEALGRASEKGATQSERRVGRA